MGKAKLYALGAGLVALSALFAAYTLHLINVGERNCEAKHAEAEEKAREDSTAVADTLEPPRQAARERVRVEVRTIYLEPDPTRCLDERAPDGVLDVLGYTGD